MSILSDKSVIIVGDSDLILDSIKEILVKHGMKLTVMPCTEFLNQIKIEHLHDLVILNHLNKVDGCSNVLAKLHTSEVYQFVPLFVLTKDINIDVEGTLDYGVSEYISPEESPESILNKVKNIFSLGNIVATGTSIDITPQMATVTTQGIRVFIVEDDPLLRNLLSTRLEKSLFPHEFSFSAEGALETMRQFLPDVIILDLMLPGKNGFELLAELREDDQFKNIPVIIFSNRDSQEDRAKANQLGASAFHVKAMTDLAELVATIESLVK